MSSVNLTSNLDGTVNRFFQANAQTRLVALYYVSQKIHRASKTATPGAFFSQKVQSVLKQIQQLPREERHEALEEILNRTPTRFTDAYAELDHNMRMAFWYRLANHRQRDALLSHTYVSTWNQEQHLLLADLETRDSNELMNFLRAAVRDVWETAIA